jgi:hypothetical protein
VARAAGAGAAGAAGAGAAAGMAAVAPTGSPACAAQGNRPCEGKFCMSVPARVLEARGQAVAAGLCATSSRRTPSGHTWGTAAAGAAGPGAAGAAAGPAAGAAAGPAAAAAVAAGVAAGVAAASSFLRSATVPSITHVFPPSTVEVMQRSV